MSNMDLFKEDSIFFLIRTKRTGLFNNTEVLLEYLNNAWLNDYINVCFQNKNLANWLLVYSKISK